MRATLENKPFITVILTAALASLAAAVIGFWVFEMDWPFLPVPLLAGVAMALVQRGDRSSQFINKLLVGSLLFGFLAVSLIDLRMYLIIHPLDQDFLFIFNRRDYLTFSFIFAFVSLLGGLAGIVVKGFYSIKKKNINVTTLTDASNPTLSQPSQFKKTLNKVPRWAIMTTLAATCLVITVAVTYHFTFAAPMRHDESGLFINPPPAPPRQIAIEGEGISKLKGEGFIRNGQVFTWVFGSTDIAPGGYEISKDMNVWQVASIIKQGPTLVWVTIPEGLRKEQIADILAIYLGWNDQQRSDWVTTYTAMDYDHTEGVYFPDTYLIPKNEPGLKVAQRLQNKFNEQFAPYADKFLKANIKWDTALKIASLVQREAGGKADMPLIAGIIWNRLLQGMKLEIDATLQYAHDSALAFDDLCKEPGNSDSWQCTCGEGDNTCYKRDGYYKGIAGWWKAITPAEKKIDSPYNTYLNKGLPPHPIANPGLDAIDAVLNSTETDCLFYLHDANKQIHCAKTYQEHLNNIQTYLRDN